MTGEELRELRTAWGMTQRELGKLLGYHYQKISDFERGVNEIPELVEKYLVTQKELRRIKKFLDDLLTS